MIKSFKDKETERIFDGLNSKKFANIQKVAKRKLDMLHYAYKEQDLRNWAGLERSGTPYTEADVTPPECPYSKTIVPPSNRFEHLKGDLKEYCSIRINDQFRVIFKFENGCAYDVQIVDYH